MRTRRTGSSRTPSHSHAESVSTTPKSSRWLRSNPALQSDGRVGRFAPSRARRCTPGSLDRREMGRTGKRDLFPVYLALGVAALAAATVVLVIAAHPTWAVVTAIASALVALPLAGWIVAWPFLEAD